MAARKTSLRILSDIQNFILPLTSDELSHLEHSLKLEGCRNPLVAWRKSSQELVIVDGHNRYRICQKYNIAFTIKELRFESVEHVKLWMIENQIGRRNLTPDQLSYYRGFKYLSIRKKRGGFVNIKAKGSTDQSTAHSLSKEFNVSESTIKRNAKFAELLDRIGESDPTAKVKILTGAVRIKRSTLSTLTKTMDIEGLISLVNKKDQESTDQSNTNGFVSDQEKRLKRIRGMIIGTINRAISNRNIRELRELKSLFSKLEVELSRQETDHWQKTKSEYISL